MAKIINHPLIEIKLTELRDKKTNHINFRKNLNEIASLMVYEILRNYQTKDKEVKTPTEVFVKGKDYAREIVIVPILRAGLGMVQGILDLVPEARIGHIGMYRDDKSFEAIPYFYKMPDVSKEAEIIIVDPMLDTGGSAKDAIGKIKKDGFRNIKFVALVGVNEGINSIEKDYPNIEIYLAAKDPILDNKKYIKPGLGDAGDRLFGTK